MIMAPSLIERGIFIDEYPIIGSIFNILVAYLTAISSDPFMTAVALTSLFLPFMDSKEDINIVDYLWGTLFYIAKQLSPSDDRQARLISLVLEIRRCPRPQVKGASLSKRASLSRISGSISQYGAV
jgi:hypothetical protein